jgi:hypothetical protein
LVVWATRSKVSSVKIGAAASLDVVPLLRVGEARQLRRPFLDQLELFAQVANLLGVQSDSWFIDHSAAESFGASREDDPRWMTPELERPPPRQRRRPTNDGG